MRKYSPALWVGKPSGTVRTFVAVGDNAITTPPSKASHKAALVIRQ
jgi:hypothetical protein